MEGVRQILRKEETRAWSRLRVGAPRYLDKTNQDPKPYRSLVWKKSQLCRWRMSAEGRLHWGKTLENLNDRLFCTASDELDWNYGSTGRIT